MSLSFPKEVQISVITQFLMLEINFKRYSFFDSILVNELLYALCEISALSQLSLVGYGKFFANLLRDRLIIKE